MNISNKIKSILENEKINYQFSFKEIKTNSKFTLKNCDKLPFASCYKIVILCLILEKYNSIEKLNSKKLITNKNLHPLASGILQSFTLPIELPVSDLLTLMMVYSDGISTDYLQSLINEDDINKFLKKTSTNSKITSNVSTLITKIVNGALELGNDLDRSSYLKAINKYTLMEDYTTSEDLISILEYSYNLSDLHKKFLLVEAGNPRMNTYSSKNVKIYSKTGTLGYFASTNEAGFILLDDTPVAIFSILTTGWKKPRYIIENIFGEIGKIIIEKYDPNYYSAFYSNSKQ